MSDETQPPPAGEQPTTPDTPAAAPESKPGNVIEAILAVMRDVRGLGKHDTNTAQGGGYKFRGIDATVNALGPAMRRHGLVVMPTLLRKETRAVTTTGNKASQASEVDVEYRFYGPGGLEDTVSTIVPGEAWDSGDKGVAKAMSVAFRIALLQTFALPTDERDPDADTYERVDLDKFRADCDKAAEGADYEDAFAAIVRDYGRDVLESTHTQAPDGVPVTAMGYVTGYLAHLREVTAQRAQERRDAARQDQAGQESQAPQEQQQPAPQQQKPQARAATAPRETPQQANIRRLVLAELAEQVKVRGLNAADVHAAIASRAEVQTIDDVPTIRLRNVVLAARNDAIVALRAAGRAQEADAYERQGTNIAPWDRLTGVDSDQAEQQEQKVAATR